MSPGNLLLPSLNDVVTPSWSRATTQSGMCARNFCNPFWQVVSAHCTVVNSTTRHTLGRRAETKKNAPQRTHTRTEHKLYTCSAVRHMCGFGLLRFWRNEPHQQQRRQRQQNVRLIRHETRGSVPQNGVITRRRVRTGTRRMWLICCGRRAGQRMNQRPIIDVYCKFAMAAQLSNRKSDTVMVGTSGKVINMCVRERVWNCVIRSALSCNCVAGVRKCVAHENVLISRRILCKTNILVGSYVVFVRAPANRLSCARAREWRKPDERRATYMHTSVSALL